MWHFGDAATWRPSGSAHVPSRFVRVRAADAGAEDGSRRPMFAAIGGDWRRRVPVVGDEMTAAVLEEHNGILTSFPGFPRPKIANFPATISG